MDKIPYEKEDMLGVLFSKTPCKIYGKDGEYSIISYDKDGVILSNGYGRIDVNYETLLLSYRWADNTECGRDK